MTSIKAVVTDLDGTLLNPDHVVPPEFNDFHTFLKSHNLAFIVASARPLGNVRKLFEGRPMPEGIVACDGAIVASLRSGIITKYAENVIPKQNAKSISEAIRAARVNPILFLTRQHDFTVVVSTEDAAVVNALRLSDPTRPIAIVQDEAGIEEILQMPIRAISALASRDEIDAAYRHLAPTVPQTSKVRTYTYLETRFGGGTLAWLDAVSHITTKEEAVRQLLLAHGVTGNQFAACGNGENDKRMLAMAGLALCPANSVASVREVCRSAVAPCNEGSPFIRWAREEIFRSLMEEGHARRDDHS